MTDAEGEHEPLRTTRKAQSRFRTATGFPRCLGKPKLCFAPRLIPVQAIPRQVTAMVRRCRAIFAALFAVSFVVGLGPLGALRAQGPERLILPGEATLSYLRGLRLSARAAPAPPPAQPVQAVVQPDPVRTPPPGQPDPTPAPSVPEKPLFIVMSLGQSLSVGITRKTDVRVLTEEPVDPAKAFGLDFGDDRLMGLGFESTALEPELFRGFQALHEAVRETHGSSMVAHLLAKHRQAGLDPPAILHFHAGHGGRSILELMTRPQDIFPDEAAGLQATPAGGHFAVAMSDERHAHYVNDGGRAVQLRETSSPLVFFDNMVRQLTMAVAHARAQGFTVQNRVGFIWIQGQGDDGRGPLMKAPFVYKDALRLLLDRVRGAARDALGPGAQVTAVISQIQGYFRRIVPAHVLEVVREDPDAHFGAAEFVYQARYPAEPDGDHTHLSPEGYYMMGQHLGARLFSALQGRPDAPITIRSVTQRSLSVLRVSFDGVSTELVEDPGLYPPANGIRPPSNLGFTLYNEKGRAGRGVPKIIAARIVGPAEVDLTFDSPVNGRYLLYLGRTEESLAAPSLAGVRSVRQFGGTTLRDGLAEPVLPPQGGVRLAHPYIYDVAPVQIAPVETAVAGSAPAR